MCLILNSALPQRNTCPPQRNACLPRSRLLRAGVGNHSFLLVFNNKKTRWRTSWRVHCLCAMRITLKEMLPNIYIKTKQKSPEKVIFKKQIPPFFLAAQSCQRTEDVELSSTRIRFFKPVREPNPNPNLSASLSPIHSQNQTLDFEEILIKRKTSFIHPQPHQLRTAIFIPGSLCFIPAIVKTLSLIEILDFTPASDPIEAR